MSIIAGFVSRVTVAAAVAVLAPRCQGSPTSAQDAAPSTTVDSTSRVYQSVMSGLTESTELVVRDDTAWRATWEQLTTMVLPAPARPAVDFAREAVVLVAAGERQSAGWRVTIDSVANAAGGALVVSYTITGPGTGCMAAQMMTSPVDVVRIPRPSGTVRFTARTVRTPC